MSDTLNVATETSAFMETEFGSSIAETKILLLSVFPYT